MEIKTSEERGVLKAATGSAVSLASESFTEGLDGVKQIARLTGKCALFLAQQGLKGFKEYVKPYVKPAIKVGAVGAGLYYTSGTLGSLASSGTGIAVGSELATAALGIGVGVAGVAGAGVAVVGGLVALGVTVKTVKALWGTTKGAIEWGAELVADVKSFCRGLKAGTQQFFAGYREQTCKRTEEKLEKREGCVVARSGAAVLRFWSGIAKANAGEKAVNDLVNEINTKSRELFGGLTDVVKQKAVVASRDGGPVRDIQAQINRCMGEIRESLTTGLVGKLAAKDVDVNAVVSAAFQAAEEKIRGLEIRKLERRRAAPVRQIAASAEEVTVPVQDVGQSSEQEVSRTGNALYDGLERDLNALPRTGMIDLEIKEDGSVEMVLRDNPARLFSCITNDEGKVQITSGVLNSDNQLDNSSLTSTDGMSQQEATQKLLSEATLFIEGKQFERAAEDLNKGGAEGQEQFRVEEVTEDGDRSFKLVGNQGNTFFYTGNKVIHYLGEREGQSWPVADLHGLKKGLYGAVRVIKTEKAFSQLQAELKGLFNEADYALTRSDDGVIKGSFGGDDFYCWYNPKADSGPFVIKIFSLTKDDLVPYLSGSEPQAIEEFKKLSVKMHTIGVTENVVRGMALAGPEVFSCQTQSDGSVIISNKAGGEVRCEINKDTSKITLTAKLNNVTVVTETTPKSLEEDLRKAVRQALPTEKTFEAAKEGVKSALTELLGEEGYSVEEDTSGLKVTVGEHSMIFGYEENNPNPWLIKYPRDGREIKTRRFLTADSAMHALEARSASLHRRRIFEEVAAEVNRDLSDVEKFAVLRRSDGGGWELIKNKGQSVLYALAENTDATLTLISTNAQGKISETPSDLKSLRANLKEAIKKAQETSVSSDGMFSQIGSRLSRILNSEDYKLTDNGNGSVECVVGASTVKLNPGEGAEFTVVVNSESPISQSDKAKSSVVYTGFDIEGAPVVFIDAVEVVFVAQEFERVSREKRDSSGAAIFKLSSDVKKSGNPRFPSCLSDNQGTTIFFDGSRLVVSTKDASESYKMCGTVGLRDGLAEVVNGLAEQQDSQSEGGGQNPNPLKRGKAASGRPRRNSKKSNPPTP